MGDCARPGTLMGPVLPTPCKSGFSGLRFLLLMRWKVVGRRERTRAQGVHRCPVPMQHSSCP